MVDYPKQVFCVWGNDISMDASFELVAPRKESSVPPLELHESNLSRFVITLLDRKSGTPIPHRVNIPANDISVIIEKMRVALNQKATVQLFSKKDSMPAYTVLMVGSFSGKTAAEVLREDPNNKDKLLQTKKWLQQHLDRYPANENKIKAIDQAIRLFDEGKLKAMPKSVYEIYRREMKTSRKYDEDGFYNCADIHICCNFSTKYPWSVTVSNYQAKKKRYKETSVIDGTTVKNKKEAVIWLSDDDFISCFRKMQDLVSLFQLYNYKTLLNRANFYFEKQLEQAQKRNSKGKEKEHETMIPFPEFYTNGKAE